MNEGFSSCERHQHHVPAYQGNINNFLQRFIAVRNMSFLRTLQRACTYERSQPLGRGPVGTGKDAGSRRIR